MRGGIVIEREMLVFLFHVYGRLWPRDLYGPVLAVFIVYRDWPLVALNPLTALRGYLYDECFRFRVFLSRFEVNMSCRLIFNSDETFNSVGSFVIFVKIIYLYDFRER